MVDRKAEGYVKSCLDAGWPLSRIRSDLYNAGWSKKDVEDAISAAKISEGRLPEERSPAPAKEDSPRFPGQGKANSRLMLYIGIIIIIAAAGLGTYYLVSTYMPQPPSNTTTVICGDGTCSGPAENYSSCQADCAPVPLCPDGSCNGQETYETCPQDCPAPPVNQNVTISIKDAGKTFGSGETVTYQAEVSGVSRLFGFQLDFEYDPTALSYMSWSEGTCLNRNAQDQTLCIPPSSSAGAVRNAACTRTGSLGVDGTGIVASYTFTSLKAGIGGVRLANVKLVDPVPRGISVQIV